MIDLFITFNESSSPKSFPPLIDLAQVTKLSLYLDTSTALTPLNSCCVIDLLKQTPNVQSLAVRARSVIERHSSSVEEIRSAIIRHAYESKLRHLEIPVSNLNQVQMLLDQFRHLFSIGLCSTNESLTSEKIIVFVKTLLPYCSILKEDFRVSIWIGERLERSNSSEGFTPQLCYWDHSTDAFATLPLT